MHYTWSVWRSMKKFSHGCLWNIRASTGFPTDKNRKIFFWRQQLCAKYGTERWEERRKKLNREKFRKKLCDENTIKISLKSQGLIFTSMDNRPTVFWCVTLCKLVRTCQWFSYTEGGWRRFLLNIGKIVIVTSDTFVIVCEFSQGKWVANIKHGKWATHILKLTSLCCKQRQFCAAFSRTSSTVLEVFCAISTA